MVDQMTRKVRDKMKKQQVRAVLYSSYKETGVHYAYLHLWQVRTSSSVATWSVRNCGVSKGIRTLASNSGMNDLRDSLSCFTQRKTASNTCNNMHTQHLLGLTKETTVIILRDVSLHVIICRLETTFVKVA